MIKIIYASFGEKGDHIEYQPTTNELFANSISVGGDVKLINQSDVPGTYVRFKFTVDPFGGDGVYDVEIEETHETIKQGTFRFEAQLMEYRQPVGDPCVGKLYVIEEVETPLWVMLKGSSPNECGYVPQQYLRVPFGKGEFLLANGVKAGQYLRICNKTGSPQLVQLGEHKGSRQIIENQGCAQFPIMDYYSGSLGITIILPGGQGAMERPVEVGQVIVVTTPPDDDKPKPV